MLIDHSGVEKAVIKASSHFPGFSFLADGRKKDSSLVNTNLEEPLCNACCKFYGTKIF